MSECNCPKYNFTGKATGTKTLPTVKEILKQATARQESLLKELRDIGMACNGCGNCEAIGRQVQWENARPSLNERLHALCREIPPTAPEFADIEARLHAVYRGFVPGNDEVLDRFVQVTKTAKNDGVPLFATECIGVTLGLALSYDLSVETRKKAMTLFCDIYEAATL